MSINEKEHQDVIWHLEQAVEGYDLDAMGLGGNMANATTEQLHEIVEFAERLKHGALIEMWGREREFLGLESSELEDPPEGYTGWHNPNAQ